MKQPAIHKDSYFKHCQRMQNKIDKLTRERDDSRAIARVLAHSYTHDSRPPQSMVDEALEFPVTP